MAAYIAKYSWAREPDYIYRPPNAIWNREQWLLYIAAHEELSKQVTTFAIDGRKVGDLTVAELMSIIKATMLSCGKNMKNGND